MSNRVYSAQFEKDDERADEYLPDLYKCVAVRHVLNRTAFHRVLHRNTTLGLSRLQGLPETFAC